MIDTGLIIVVTLFAAAVAAVAQYLYKKSVKKFGFSVKEIVRVFRNGHTVLGIALYVVSLLIYLYALHAAPVVFFVYPIFSSSLVFVLLISKYVLKERMGIRRVMGVALIVAGIAIISLTL